MHTGVQAKRWSRGWGRTGQRGWQEYEALTEKAARASGWSVNCLGIVLKNMYFSLGTGNKETSYYC